MSNPILPENVAVLLLRMSTAKQDKSIQSQRDELFKLAEKKGYRVKREYTDLGGLRGRHRGPGRVPSAPGRLRGRAGLLDHLMLA